MLYRGIYSLHQKNKQKKTNMQIATLLSTANCCHRLVHPNEFHNYSIENLEKNIILLTFSKKEEHHVGVLEKGTKNSVWFACYATHVQTRTSAGGCAWSPPPSGSQGHWEQRKSPLKASRGVPLERCIYTYTLTGQVRVWEVMPLRFPPALPGGYKLWRQLAERERSPSGPVISQKKGNIFKKAVYSTVQRKKQTLINSWGRDWQKSL